MTEDALTSLTQQREQARAAARNARQVSQQYADLAAENDARVASLDAAVIALGGTPLSEMPDPDTTLTLDPDRDPVVNDDTGNATGVG